MPGGPVNMNAADLSPVNSNADRSDTKLSRAGSGVQGNARLTSLTGLILLGLLFVEGITVLAVRSLLSVHVFVGLLILPPLALKLGSTGYRFAMYYLGNARYRAAGPPQIVLRVVAPFMVAATIGLFGSGIALLLVGPYTDGLWRRLHTLSFFGWFWLMAIHVLAHTPRAMQLGFFDLAGSRFRRGVPGALTRESLVVGSIILGVVVAVAFLPLDTSWLQWGASFHGGG